MQLKFSSTRLSWLLLIWAIALFPSFVALAAIATTEPIATSEAAKTPGIDLEGYVPDQKDWSDKAKANYEKKKNGGGLPLAMLTIERLNLKAPVYMGTSRATLDRGLGMIEGTAHLGGVGNIGISGHRDGFFRPLKDIKPGDLIEIQTPVGVQSFEVSDITIVDALEISVLDPTDTTVLTLITCHPFYYEGYAPDRYIVRAIPVASGGDESNSDSKEDATNQTSTELE